MSVAKPVSNAIAKALKMFGVPILFRVSTDDEVYNPETGETTQTYTEFYAQGLKEAYTQKDLIGDNNLINIGDLKITTQLISTDGDLFSVEQNDEIVIDNIIYTIISIAPTFLQDKTIVFEIQARNS